MLLNKINLDNLNLLSKLDGEYLIVDNLITDWLVVFIISELFL